MSGLKFSEILWVLGVWVLIDIEVLFGFIFPFLRTFFLCYVIKFPLDLRGTLLLCTDAFGFFTSRLDVYIHDYLVKRDLKASAQAFQAEGKVSSDPVGKYLKTKSWITGILI